MRANKWKTTAKFMLKKKEKKVNGLSEIIYWYRSAEQHLAVAVLNLAVIDRLKSTLLLVLQIYKNVVEVFSFQ